MSSVLVFFAGGIAMFWEAFQPSDHSLRKRVEGIRPVFSKSDYAIYPALAFIFGILLVCMGAIAAVVGVLLSLF